MVFKKLMEVQEKHNTKYNEKILANADKLESSMNVQFEKDVQDALFEGEEVVQTYGLVSDFACITNKRVFFVDKKLRKVGNQKEIVSIPLRHIQTVTYDIGMLLGEVEIAISHKTYEIKLASTCKEIC
ncbi:PH domain-containing protein [Peribacillus butanolivorans]|uniref:PH domain-containing protein n=1 Tax=Peribacillus butanolivorans TaxID=421767 RepID=UPI0039FD7FA6